MLAWIVTLVLTIAASIGVANSSLMLEENQIYLRLTLAAMMWIPGVVALIFAKKEQLSLPIFKRNWVPLVAVLVMLLIGAAAIIFSLPFGHYWGFESLRPKLGDQLDAFHPHWLMSLFIYTILIAYAALAGLTINALAGLGEELMWRGYLWEHWKRHGVVRYILWTGLCWGIWHWPVIMLIGFMYPKTLVGLAAIVAICLLLSPLHLYFRLRGGSIYPAAVFHGTLNAVGSTTLLVFRDPDPLIIGVPGAVGMVVLAVINTLFWKRLRALAKSEGENGL